VKILASGGKLRCDPPIWDDPAGQGSPLGTRFGEIMSMTSMKLTAIFMKVPEGYVAFIEELPGANTQGATLDEARENLHEAVALVLDANRAMSEQSLEGAAVIRETFVLPAA
jgi:predicted RNase H-like HicB family nuclease